MSIAMLACIGAMLIGGLAILAFDLNSAFFSTRARVKSLARVTTENSHALLASGSSAELISTLNGVMDYPNVTDAAIYIADGRAAARPTKQTNASLPATIPADVSAGTHLGFAGMRHYEPIMQDGQRIGMLALEIGTSQVWSVLRLYTLIGIGAIALTVAVARKLLGRFQGMISEPIAELAQFAESVAKDGNYSLRAAKRNEDEVGFLADKFNGMLEEIEERDAALLQAKADLEKANEKPKPNE